MQGHDREWNRPNGRVYEALALTTVKRSGRGKPNRIPLAKEIDNSKGENGETLLKQAINLSCSKRANPGAAWASRRSTLPDPAHLDIPSPKLRRPVNIPSLQARPGPGIDPGYPRDRSLRRGGAATVLEHFGKTSGTSGKSGGLLTLNWCLALSVSVLNTTRYSGRRLSGPLASFLLPRRHWWCTFERACVCPDYSFACL
jgi:hypothetical protein